MSAKKKTPSVRQKKPPSGRNAGSPIKGCVDAARGKMQMLGVKKIILKNLPYTVVFYLVNKEAWLYRHCTGNSMATKLWVLFQNFSLAFRNPLPSLHLWDVAVGIAGTAALMLAVYMKGKNAKKYRQGVEYGSARWGTAKDIEPFIDPVFENNVLLTQTERLTVEMPIGLFTPPIPIPLQGLRIP